MEESSSRLVLRENDILTLPGRGTNLVGGLTVPHSLTKPDVHPYDAVSWVRKTAEFQKFQREVEVPEHWGPQAVNITAGKYLFGSSPDQPQYEDSFQQLFDRLANTYTVWGWKHGYFAALEDAKAFNYELKHMLVRQMWAPNSPVWFNVGLWEQWRWGRPDLRELLGNRGNKAFKAHVNESTSELVIDEISNVYAHPQASACFLTEVGDSMESILHHQVTEGRIFASGSGVGVNLSSLRSSFEPIAGRGASSGPIPFNRGWDTMAGAIKSGGKTRRAARMVIMDSDHPDVFTFITTKKEQEDLAKIILREHNLHAQLLPLAREKRLNGSPAEKVAAEVILTLPVINDTAYDPGMDGLVYADTISHQNANHCVSLKPDYWTAYYAEGNYRTRWITQPNQVQDTFKAEDLLKAIADSVWANSEPGIHNSDWINLWSPFKAVTTINTSNPCSEYFAPNGTSCNLSSFNAKAFVDTGKRDVDVETLQHCARLAMLCADLNVEEGGFPTPEVAEGTYLYRTTGIGYANLGGALMALGIPYDSDEGRWIVSQLVSMLSASCWVASAEMGRELGSYLQYEQTREDLQQVLTLHTAVQDFAQRLPQRGPKQQQKLLGELEKKYPKSARYQQLGLRQALDALARSFESPASMKKEWTEWAMPLAKKTMELWQAVGKEPAFRNSFVSLLAPTGTISAPLSCYDAGTTSAEPDFSLVKYKMLAGGGMLTLFNEIALEGLLTLGYSERQATEAALEVAGVKGLFAVCRQSLERVANHLSFTDIAAGPVRQAFQKLRNAAAGQGMEELLADLQRREFAPDLSPDERLLLNGKGHMEALPWLKSEHLPVFDCSMTGGADGKRFIQPKGHMRMLGAIQPFISGATSKTVNLPAAATPEVIRECLVDCHQMGIKCVALYREDSKGVTVFQTQSPEGRRWEINRVWNELVHQVAHTTEDLMTEAAKPRRTKLPGVRHAQTVKWSIGGSMEGFLTVGVYPDGRCGEIFGFAGQAGGFAGGMFGAFCKSFSISLQYGVPLPSLIESFRYVSFDPAGFTKVGDGPNQTSINSCKSVIDLCMQILEWLFPEDNDYRLRSFEGSRQIGEFEVAVSPAVPLPEAEAPDDGLPANKSAMTCPKCGSLSYVLDGKCRSCRSCGYKDGGCGE
ncbi:MAG: ribonucleoside-diphosphate reductase alpha chain [Puniceicoccaceae bacterium 5H]|nr:MAG: ribonucleoside-diphosphate reductase alpha chain [Puniceicoccaceae bacterium 5H]